MSNYNAQINRAIVIVDRRQLARPDAEARLGPAGWGGMGAAPPGQPSVRRELARITLRIRFCG